MKQQAAFKRKHSFGFVAAEEEATLIKDAAWRSRKSLSAYIREVAIKAARADLAAIATPSDHNPA
ncbi:MAG: hypothetical protein AB4911_12635 [Oscillochloridaceae bacterium umkhey_bin13]